jgi:hypothetical protein
VEIVFDKTAIVLSNRVYQEDIPKSDNSYTPKKRVKKTIGTDTDENPTPQSTQEVSIAGGESYSFDRKVEFPNSAIEFTDSGVAVRYINFTIGSFNSKLEFHRLYYTHFGTGNIIDVKENLDYGGRIFENGNKKILGSTISSRPLILTLRGENFILTNGIKEAYTVILKTPTTERELNYQEELIVSKDEMFSNSNTLSIGRDGITLLEIEIVAN